MDNIYKRLGLPRVINGSGRMTYLGVSTFSKGVAQAFLDSAQNYVIVDDLMDVIGKKISNFTKAEDTCITASASSGIVLSIAAMIAKDNLTQIEQLPKNNGINQVIIPKGHTVNYGAPIATMVSLAGGDLVEVGQSNQVKKEHIISAINEKTCALLYVKSHHCVQKGMPSIQDMVAIAKEYNIPLIIDAAAEDNLQKYIALGADLVIYSGAKALQGPTSGFITGNAKLIKLCKKQYKGIGRAMKVSKETMSALYQAIVEYSKIDNQSVVKEQKELLHYLEQGLKDMENVKISIEQDESGREIYRLKIQVLESSKKDALTIVQELKDGEISIHLRDHYANTGVFYIDPRGLINDDKDVIINKMKQII